MDALYTGAMAIRSGPLALNTHASGIVKLRRQKFTSYSYNATFRASLNHGIRAELTLSDALLLSRT